MTTSTEYLFSLPGFLNSNLLIALITFLAGSITIILYYKQRRDVVREAATIILSDIYTIENYIQELKNSKVNEQISIDHIRKLVSLLPNNTWNTYKHFFVKKRFFLKHLDSDDFEKLGIFFRHSELLQNEFNRIDKFTLDTIQYKSNLVQEKLIELAKEIVKDKNITDILLYPEEYKKIKDELLGIVQKEDYVFPANYIQNYLSKYLESSIILTGTTTFQKLKDIAGNKE